MMSRVMITFWMVKKKFSPYVENGNRFREAYAREIPYDAVSRILHISWSSSFQRVQLTYAERDNPLAEPEEMIFMICPSA